MLVYPLSPTTAPLQCLRSKNLRRLPSDGRAGMSGFPPPFPTSCDWSRRGRRQTWSACRVHTPRDEGTVFWLIGRPRRWSQGSTDSLLSRPLDVAKSQPSMGPRGKRGAVLYQCTGYCSHRAVSIRVNASPPLCGPGGRGRHRRSVASRLRWVSDRSDWAAASFATGRVIVVVIGA